MMVFCANMKNINNELRRTRYELMLLEHFANPRVYRGPRESSDMPVTTYEKAATLRFRTRMTRIGRIFTDIFDGCAFWFNSSDNKPQRPQRTQSRSVFYRNPSAFICVHLRLISVSLSDRTQKIKGEI